MAEETPRDAALRALLVDRAGAAVPRRAPSRARETDRLRVGIVTAAVLLAVVATSTVVLAASRPADRVAQHGPAPVEPRPLTPPTPSAATSGAPLVTPTGWRRITRAQLHAFVLETRRELEDPESAAVWEEQAWLAVGCMADAGYVYDPVADAEGHEAPPPGLDPAEQQGYGIAMYGPRSDGLRDWTTSGCHGRAVHETGQDDAH